MDRNPFFFQHYGLTENDLERYLAAALSAGGDYADIYFEYHSSTSLTVDESLVKSASQGISVGCGIRVISGERTGYAYTDDLSSGRIQHAARTAALIASGPAKTLSAGFQRKPARSLYPVTLPSVDAEITAKVELVNRADQAARAFDVRIKEVRASYADELRTILVVGSDGTFAEDSQPLARMNVSCIARNETNSARGTSGGGGRVALDFFFGDKTPEYFAREASRQAVLQLDAREAPAGDMEVVLGPGWPGVLLHEAVGHGLEADFNRKKTSAFSGLIGKRVASEKVTVVDNGTMPWRRGSLNVDDEGHPTQETVLIEKGILKGYLSDKLSAKLMGMADTGNGRGGLDQLPGARTGPGAGAGDPVQDGRRAGQVQRAADRRAARRGPEDRGEVGEQGDVAHAGGPERDRDGHRDQHGPPVQERRRARLPQRRAQGGGEPGLVSGLAEQDRPGMADQPLPLCGDLQGMVPPVKLHDEERSSSRGYRRGNP